jgi:RimJ/RimL family protein N-acetyltransferase
MSQTKHRFIDGKHINLRRPTEEDALNFWYDWFNDPEVALYTGWWKPNTPANQLDFLRNLEASNNAVVLIIEEKMSSSPIGVVSLSKINWVQGVADIALVIGEESARKKATLGLEALILMVRHAFLSLNLRNIRGGFASGQEASQLMLKALDFREVGKFENIFTINGNASDHILVHLTAEDWKKRNYHEN